MSCDWSAKLDRYVDDDLTGSERVDLEAHLRGCPSCAADALSRLQLKRKTQAAGQRFAPSPEFRLKIEQSIRAPKRHQWSSRWIPALAAVAAMGLLTISGVLWQQHTRTQQALGELADLHVATLASANPVDVVSTDRHTVKPWFQGKLPFSFNIPELQNTPFKLIGGRVAYFQQNPGAQLLFEIGKHQVSVFIFQDRAELSWLSSGSTLRGRLGFSSETWVNGGLRYFILSDAGAADVQALSELLKSAQRS